MKTIAEQINWDFEANGKLLIKDNKNSLIYHECSNGYWTKREYDSEGNEIYFEDSDKFWAKWEYDSQGNQIYYADSEGDVEDNRPKPSEDSVVEIDGVKYKLIKL